MKQSFTEGKIFSPLLRFTLPLLLALFLQTMYGIVDMKVIGMYREAPDISAVATGGNIMQAITGIITGLSSGVTVLLGQRIGAKEGEKAGKILGTGIVFFAILSLGLTVLLEALAVPIARVMQAPAEAFEGTVRYLRVCSGGCIFIIAYNLLGSIFRGMGNAKVPLLSVLVACVLNIGLDLLFVGGLGMGVEGAALATVISQGISVVFCLLVARRRGLPFPFRREMVRLDKKETFSVVRMGGPVALQDLLMQASFLVVSAIVNSLGVVESAGVGVANKLTGFIMMVPMAFLQATAAFVAQNVGAKKPERGRRAMAYSMLTAAGVGLIFAWLTFFQGEWLAGIFTPERPVVLACADYLKSYTPDCVICAVLFALIGYFSGYGKTTFVMIQGILGAFCVRVPLSFLFGGMRPVSLLRIGLAVPIASLVQVLICGTLFVVLYRKEKRARIAA